MPLLSGTDWNGSTLVYADWNTLTILEIIRSKQLLSSRPRLLSSMKQCFVKRCYLLRSALWKDTYSSLPSRQTPEMLPGDSCYTPGNTLVCFSSTFFKQLDAIKMKTTYPYVPYCKQRWFIRASNLSRTSVYSRYWTNAYSSDSAPIFSLSQNEKQKCVM